MEENKNGVFPEQQVFPSENTFVPETPQVIEEQVVNEPVVNIENTPEIIEPPKEAKNDIVTPIEINQEIIENNIEPKQENPLKDKMVQQTEIKEEVVKQGPKKRKFNWMILIVLLLSIMVLISVVSTFSKPKKKEEEKNEEKVPTYCDNVSKADYFKHFNLEEDNIKVTSISKNTVNKKEEVRISYYLLYEGFPFSEEVYYYTMIEDKVTCQNNDKEKNKDPLSKEKLKQKYDNLTSEQLKKQLNSGIYYAFDMFNLMSSKEMITSYIKRCELSITELEQQLTFVTTSYSTYLKENKKYEKITYTRDEVYDAIRAALSTVKPAEDE